MLRDALEHRAYPVEIFWSAEEQAYIAVAPDLKGCVVAGDTRAEAAGIIDGVIQDYLKIKHEVGDPIPAPSRAFSAAKRRP